MQFNEKLLLTDQDLILLEHTSVTKRITKVLHNLKQSVAAKDILSCLAETER